MGVESRSRVFGEETAALLVIAAGASAAAEMAHPARREVVRWNNMMLFVVNGDGRRSLFAGHGSSR